MYLISNVKPYGKCWQYRSPIYKTRMWANAQPDGRPAEHRWHLLFNAAKFGWRSLLDCRAVNAAKTRKPLKLPGVPQTTYNSSAAVVGRSSPYCWDIWRRYCCLTSFFPIVDTCISCEGVARQSCTMVCRWRLLATFLRPVYPASRVQHVSDLHLKFTRRPCTISGSIANIQSPTAEIKRGKKKRRRKKEETTG